MSHIACDIKDNLWKTSNESPFVFVLSDGSTGKGPYIISYLF